MRRMIVLLVLLPSKLFALSPLSADDVLLRMQQAALQQSFQGSFSYQRGGDFSTYRIWRQSAGSQEEPVRERLLRLDGEVQEWLREGDKALCASSDLQEALPLSGYIKQRLNLAVLQSGYEIGFANDSRIAGRKTWVLTLMPRDKHRYAMELHIDKKTAIVLKAALLDEHWQVLESVQFLSFTADAPTAGELTPSSACLPPVTQHWATSGVPASNPWQLPSLPAGFHLLNVENSESPLADGWQTHLTYTDGLARFSVFLEPVQAERRETPTRQFGPTAVVSRNRHLAGADWMVTVVGEIPPTTAEIMVFSINRATPQSP